MTSPADQTTPQTPAVDVTKPAATPVPGSSVTGAATPVLAPKRTINPIGPNGILMAEYKRSNWFCQVAEGVTLEDVLTPEFWAHVAQKLKPLDRIEVVAYDCSWIAELIVITKGRTAAKVKVLQSYKLEGSYADMAEVNRKHEIKLRGPRKWCIMRISDGAPVKEDIDTREAANAALADYEKALGY